MKKIIVLILLLIITITTLTGCMGNSGNLTEGLTNGTNTFWYIVTYEAGEYHLHEIRKWKDGGSDALGISTACCSNQFWTSYNVAVMYEHFPKHMSENVIVCDNVNKEK